MTVRKKLQKLGNSRVLLIDRDLLAVLHPDGDVDATLLVEVVGSALVVRREGAPAPALGEVEQAATVAAPEVPGLSPTKRLVLMALQRGPATRGELAETIGRAPETVSAALKTLKEQGLTAQTGRDWRLTPTAKTRLETDDDRKFAGLAPSLARLVVVLEGGPLTAAELTDRIGLPRRTVNDLLARAIKAGLVNATNDATPHYNLKT